MAIVPKYPLLANTTAAPEFSATSKSFVYYFWHQFPSSPPAVLALLAEAMWVWSKTLQWCRWWLWAFTKLFIWLVPIGLVSSAALTIISAIAYAHYNPDV